MLNRRKFNHDLDVHPIPKEKQPMYINEPWLIDDTLLEYPINKEPDDESDNIRIYIPMDLNKESILRRLRNVIAKYGAASEKNESDYSVEVGQIISQIEIYDQIWFVRNIPKAGNHSEKAIELVKEFISMLEEIPDECAERFPFDTINELKGEFLREE